MQHVGAFAIPLFQFLTVTIAKFVLYLASILTGLVACFAAFFLFVDRFVIPDRDVALLNYHQILLEAVPSPRIIIESGSNSAHGIEPALIEAAFGLPTIDIADYAGVPLPAKVSRLEKYARAGDIILMPLEWPYYFRDSYSSDFLEGMINPNDPFDSATYYFALSRLDRMDLVFRYMNFHYLSEGLAYRFNENHYERIAWRLDNVLAEMDMSLEGDVKMPWIRTREVRGETCQTFIGAFDSPLSGMVQAVAARLAKLQMERHLKIIVTWPAVAGKDCYDSRALAHLVSRVRTMFARAGIQVIGTPQDSLFSDPHVLNTYYHIDPAAAHERTLRLIEVLKSAGLRANPTPARAIRPLVAAAVAQEQDRINASVSARLLPLAAGVYTPGTDEFKRHFYLVKGGWQQQESWGVWSRGASSIISIGRVPESCQMTLKARYLRPDRPARVFVDDVFVKTEDGAPVALAPSGGAVSIRLDHPEPKSPKELGLSNDERTIAFGLEKIIVQCNTTLASGER
ncbi:MAG TPA: hypothetical protein VKV77_13315 [Methylovirgula sp.]|nr:hypothetical protein [Methylovirgula sp.]